MCYQTFFLQKDCKETPYSIIGATNPNCKYHALNLGGWEGISPFPPLGYALVCTIGTGSCCAQLLWMTQTLKDYGIYVKHVTLVCDNESAIKIAHNHVQQSQTKRIDVRHHFIRHHVAKGDIDLKHVRTDKQLADIFTKPLDEKVFCCLRGELNIIDASNLA